VQLLPNHLTKLFDLLDEHGIFYWIDAGSLLKGVRNQSILESSDIDISAKSDDISKIIRLASIIEKEGYQVSFQGSMPYVEDLVCIKLPKVVNKISTVDIYIYHLFDNHYVRRSSHKPLQNSYSKHLYYLSKRFINEVKYSGGLSTIFYVIPFKIRKPIGKALLWLYERIGSTMWYVVPEVFFCEFTTILVHKRQFFIPKLYKEYLNYRYGESWTRPIPRIKWIQSWKNGDSEILVKRKLREGKAINKKWLAG